MDTSKVKKVMIAAMRKSLGNVSISCDKADISRQTHYNWITDDPEYAQAIKDISERRLDFLESKADQRANEGSDSMIQFLLRTIGRDRGYGVEMKLEHSGKIETTESLAAEIAEMLKSESDGA